jgi:PIN domain nuclease of toxin-antitoxin system
MSEARKLYLDTHVLIWLYSKDLQRFTERGIKMIEGNNLFISPMVCLELDYLHEFKKTSVSGKKIVEYLSRSIGLTVCDAPFPELVYAAAEITWTRDPFDRLIVAQAKLLGSPILTKDRVMLDHYKKATW